MPFVIKDRIKELTTTTGTGAISLGGATATFEAFSSYMTNGDTTYYAIVHTTSGVDEWEVGVGTWNTGNTLTRTTVLAGSNGASAVNFSAGTKDIFMTYPASKALFMDASGDVDLTNDVTVGGNIDIAGSAEVETYIDLKTTTLNKPSHAEGRIFYDAAFGALAVYNDEADITLQVGQEEYIRVKNNSGATITNGTPVYLTGEDQSTPTIAAAKAEGTYAESQAVGVATHDIENNTTGYITVRGLIADVDTSHLTVGEKVHVGVGGGTTTTAPSYPYFATDVGICLISAASGGCIYVYVETHAFETLRVTDNAHFDGNVTIDGDLTVLGDQTIAASSNISIGNAWNYFNAGDTIGADNTAHTGSGLDDAVLVGHFNGTASKTFYVKIDGTGTPDTFSWSDDNFATTEATGVAITGAEQDLADGVKIEFNATTGHTLNDVWSGTAAPSNVDTGIASNRNTGGSGVGYTHIGLYYDVSTNKWTFFDEYDPEPEGTIDTTDSSFGYATVKAGTFEGNLDGNVTGDLTGNVSGNVTGSLTGNVTGNVTGDVVGDVTGNADTASALETARTIQLSGDVTGSVSFDGSANATITATVQDDSHSHVISNVDGLQTALDGKTPTSRTITAGGGLTGGGNLTANRTLSHADTSSQASLTALTGAAVVSDVDVDTYGHVTGLSTRNMTLADLGYTGETDATADQTITAGSGLSGGGTGNVTLNHANTSSQISVNNSDGTVIQDITLDTYGHITGVNSVNLDGRYYTESQADSLFVNASGDTMTGTLTIDTGASKNALVLRGTSPALNFIDEGSSDDFYIYVNSNNFYVLRDIEGADTVGTGWDTPNPLQLEGDTNRGYLFGNRMFADDYHPNADKWTTARTLSLSGDASGSVSWDGSSNATLSVTVANDSHTHDGRYYTESEADSRFVNTSGDTMTGVLTLSNGSDLNLSTSGTDLGDIVWRDSSGEKHRLWDGGTGLTYRYRGGTAYKLFHDGYHPNADKWTTARTLSLTGDASGSTSWDGSGNASISVTVADDSHSHHRLQSDVTTSTPDSALQYFQTAQNTSINPTTDWYNTIRMGHGDPVTYFSNTIAVKMTGSNTGDLYTRTIAAGTAGSWNRYWHSNNDGSGSGLDADKLDGLQASQFLRSDANDSTSGNLTVGGTLAVLGNRIGFINDVLDAEIRVDDGNPDGTGAVFEFWGDAVQGNAQVKAESFRASSTVFVGSQIELRESTDRADLLQITSSTGSWGGLQIRNSSNEGRWSFMTDGEVAGIYNDEDDQWHIYMREGQGVELRYASSTKLATTSTGISLSGQIDMNNNDIVGVDQIFHEGDPDTYIQFHAADQFRVVTGGSERLEVNNSRTQIDNLLVTGTATFSGIVTGSAITDLGAVGTYGGFRDNTATARAPGSTTSGSNLRWVGFFAYGGTNYKNTAPSGTWRLMGASGYYENNSGYGSQTDKRTALWVRIS